MRRADNSKIIQAMLENREVVKEKRKDKVKFLSDRDSAAQGQLTRNEKGFESISTDYVLSPGDVSNRCRHACFRQNNTPAF
jgi:hypothetical protein